MPYVSLLIIDLFSLKSLDQILVKIDVGLDLARDVDLLVSSDQLDVLLIKCLRCRRISKSLDIFRPIKDPRRLLSLFPQDRFFKVAMTAGLR